MAPFSRNTILLPIDLQKAIDTPSWGVRNNLDAETRIAELLAFWRAHQLPLLHVKHMSTDPTSTYRPGQIGNDFKPVAQPRPEEEILEKQTNSAFIGTDLEARLHGRDITEIVIIGVITNNSVEATARMAGNLGFRTAVISDATFTFGKNDYNGVFRTAEEVHALSLANMDGEYAEIYTTADLLNNIHTTQT